LLWMSQMTNLEEHARSYAYTLAIDSKDNIIISGSFVGNILVGNGNSSQILEGNRYVSNIFFVKYSPQGTMLWATSANGNSVNLCNSIAIDPKTDTIYAVGYFAYLLSFNF